MYLDVFDVFWGKRKKKRSQVFEWFNAIKQQEREFTKKGTKNDHQIVNRSFRRRNSCATQRLEAASYFQTAGLLLRDAR